MTTKEQERKALEQIKKIVAGLGENSYVGTAFAGCFEDAEQNIEYDAAFSMKGQLELTERTAAALRAEKAKLEQDLKEVRAHAAGVEESLRRSEEYYEGQLNEMRATLKKVTEDRESTQNTLDATKDQLDDMEHKMLAAQDEVIKLKAMLFDLMYADKMIG